MVIACGVAAPAMLGVAAVTVAAGVLTSANGVSDRRQENMRKLIVKRNKSRVGIWIKYWCVIDVSLTECKKIFGTENRCSGEFYPIANGEILEIPIENKEYNFFVMAQTSTGLIYSNEVIIEQGEENVVYEIETRYSFIRGSKLYIKKIID